MEIGDWERRVKADRRRKGRKGQHRKDRERGMTLSNGSPKIEMKAGMVLCIPAQRYALASGLMRLTVFKISTWCSSDTSNYTSIDLMQV